MKTKLTITLTRVVEIDVAATTPLLEVVSDYYNNLKTEGYNTKVVGTRTRRNGKLDIATRHD